jgi:hypothetical protein
MPRILARLESAMHNAIASTNCHEDQKSIFFKLLKLNEVAV